MDTSQTFTFPERDLRPAPPELVAHASALAKQFIECFWFRHPEADIETIADVRLIIEHLREYGDKNAWKAAQELRLCL